ncbi:AbiH family protein [Clostridium perfringens]|uniref:AbiH family protein n=1 Tax=Clostridium perfringens TaxID=1502 RepID=UPI0034A33927
MSITYLIGNGFDISVGLKTKYSDFYKYVINSNELKNDNNEILESIKNESDLWSDLELGLGNYTEGIGNDIDKLEKFYDDKFQIDIILREYLKTQQENIDWEKSKDNIQKNFMESIYSFYSMFNTAQRNKIKEVINHYRIGDYNIISFNYTNVIEKCVQLSEETIKLVYLHGSLKNDNTILGVNDSEQIKNKFFKESSEMSIVMNKLKINEDIGEYTINKAENILEKSLIVCVYGMSIGDTDKYWWEKIIENLVNNKTKMVIIFHYEPNLDMRDRLKVSRAENNIKDQLLRYSSEDEKIKDELKRKIMVKCNSSMFNMELVFKNSNELVMQ